MTPVEGLSSIFTTRILIHLRWKTSTVTTSAGKWERPRADFHLHWPGKAYRIDLNVLIAGCGTSQAARHALRQPASQIVGIDVSATSVRHTEALKRKFNLTNLEIFQLPIEEVGTMGRSFDKIVCTGVLHHLPSPDFGLRALRECLRLTAP